MTANLSRRRIFGIILAIALTLYAFACAALFFGQRSIIFPAPARQAALPAGFHQVPITSADGLTLLAAYKPATLGRPTVVFFHGNGDNWGGGSAATEHLAAMGYGILLPEYRGYSGNPGQPSEEGLYQDGRAAIEWLGSRGVSGEQLIVIGNSIGSGVAVQMATEARPRALILISPFESLVALAGEKFRWFPARMLVRDRFANGAKIAKVDAPVLILHGASDTLIPLHHARKLVEALPSAKLISFEGVGHELAYAGSAQRAEADWLEGLSRQARVSPPKARFLPVPTPAGYVPR